MVWNQNVYMKQSIATFYVFNVNNNIKYKSTFTINTHHINVSITSQSYIW